MRIGFSGMLIALAALLCLTPANAKDSAKDDARPLLHYSIGKLHARTPGPVSGGLLLLGGGDRDHDAMQWFFSKAGNGHIVILRASQGAQIGEEFYRELGGIQSAETFVFHDRSAATDRRMLARLRKAAATEIR